MHIQRHKCQKIFDLTSSKNGRFAYENDSMKGINCVEIDVLFQGDFFLVSFWEESRSNSSHLRF